MFTSEERKLMYTDEEWKQLERQMQRDSRENLAYVVFMVHCGAWSVVMIGLLGYHFARVLGWAG